MSDVSAVLLFLLVAVAVHLLRRNGELSDLKSLVALESSRADGANKLLSEIVGNLPQGFAIYDQNDKLMLFNQAYLTFHDRSRDSIVVGASFEEILKRSAVYGQYSESLGDFDGWVTQRLAQHRRANGEPIEQRLSDGRWLLVSETKTPSGYIVGSYVEISEQKNTAEELGVRELYLRATIDNLPFFFWLKDTDSRFLAVNKVFAEACGRYLPEEVSGLTDYDVWPAELAERYRADDAVVMASRNAKAVEEPIAGGSESGWIETYKKPVVTPDGRLLGTVGFARDITERVLMSKALSESELRWELAVRGANDGIWDWNPKTGRVHFSERWKTMLGYEPNEVGEAIEEWSSRIHPDDLDFTMGEVDRHLKGETEFYQCEHRLRCKDGNYIWILDRGKALFNEAGQAIRMAGSHTDITKRREAEARIREHTEQLNAIFTLSPDGFVSFDNSYCVSYANPAFLEMFSLKSEDVVGLDEPVFSHLIDRCCADSGSFLPLPTLRQQLADASSKSMRRIAIELTRPVQRVVEVGLCLSELGVVSQILYFQDVTHQTEVDRMKSEFLSTAAHELRTPMASIYGFSEVMLNQKFPPDVELENLRAIHKQASLMSSIINELLDLARIEARRGKDFHFNVWKIEDIVKDVLSTFKPPDGRQLPVCHFLDKKFRVRCDDKKINQAISNVLSNAYKYSLSGSQINLFIVEQCSSTDAGERMIGICIEDKGIGMTKQQMDRIFERFYRVDRSGKIPGTGLGLSIVKEIMGFHDGTVGVESEFGCGTSMTLWLPEFVPGSFK